MKLAPVDISALQDRGAGERRSPPGAGLGFFSSISSLCAADPVALTMDTEGTHSAV